MRRVLQKACKTYLIKGDDKGREGNEFLGSDDFIIIANLKVCCISSLFAFTATNMQRNNPKFRKINSNQQKYCLGQGLHLTPRIVGVCRHNMDLRYHTSAHSVCDVTHDVERRVAFSERGSLPALHIYDSVIWLVTVRIGCCARWTLELI